MLREERVQTEAGAAVTAPVLVVDDDPIVRGMIRQALEDDGLAVVTAADGQEALQEATRVRPRLVILDLSLPVLNGETVAARLRGIIADDPVRIMVITADGHPAEKARAVGAFAYLGKPFNLSDLVDIVHRGLDFG
jgi:CheY-like chemotaxis protein